MRLTAPTPTRTRPSKHPVALAVAYRLVPVDLVVLGAAVAGVSCQTIATYAMRTFELQEHIAARRSEASAEPDVIDAKVVGRAE